MHDITNGVWNLQGADLTEADLTEFVVTWMQTIVGVRIYICFSRNN